ncbi:AMP-binding protein [Pararoseomonas sp. SCSIO 73927]|uniref:class I adenylate-forming enzyme family protein n=1 Tax=Pararoseomonas sp. SCSIO 73927 TaxID=3114537 RepID=UPI0030D561F3
MNLADALAHHVRARPDRPALIHGGRTILYRDLDGLVRRWAAHLSSLGLERGDVLGIALKDTADHVLALYASARLGTITLPIDVRWTRAEMQSVAARFRAKRVLVEGDALPIEGLDCVPVDRAFLDAVASARTDMQFPAGAACGEMPLLVSLSSGTTGRPKGPVVTHYQFLRRFWTHWIDLGLDAKQVYVSATPLYFGGGRTFAMSQLFCGGTVVLFPPPYKPEDLVREVEFREATSCFLVPTLIRRLLDLAPDKLLPMRRLSLLLSSGAPLHANERAMIRDRISAGFHEYYASTEGGGVSLLRPQDVDRHADSVGRPVFGVEVRVQDNDGRPLPPGEVGRLAYRGPGVASGFFDDAEADADAFQDGWFLPGDLATIDQSGFIRLRGRGKDMIIRAGVNIYPMEIEALLSSHPAVHDAVVVGWPAREMGEEVAAFILPRGPLDLAELHKLCADRLASYKRPREFFLVTDLPRNASGKILKAELAKSLPPIR